MKVIGSFVRGVRAFRQDGPCGGLRRIRNPLVAEHVRRTDERFDRRLGIETTDGVFLDTLRIASDNLEHGVEYAPTPSSLWPTLTGILPRDLREWNFVDFGCGKGRNLILATSQPYRRIIGVDFSPELADIARRNIRAARANDPRIVVECADAACFALPPGNTVAFLYNPFGAPVLEAVVRNMEASVLNGNRLWVIYYNPAHGAVLEASAMFLRRRYRPAAKLHLAVLGWHRAAAFESRNL